MKKIVFAGITALIFSCGMGVASAYSYNQEQAAKKAAQAKECSCSECSCTECACTDCSHADCTKGCCDNGAACSNQHAAK